MKYEKSIAKDELNELVDKWSKTTFGKNFVFRNGQKEAIVETIFSWFNEKHNIIINGPTGTGKSFIALSVAGVLSTYFNLKGYILISDLSLIDQYARDVEMFFPDFAILKGQQNYTCIVNNLNYTVGECKLNGDFTLGKIIDKYQDCSPYCEYIQQKMKAMKSSVVLCTYSFWLLQENMYRNDNSSMESRDFVICDECHKLLDIVQSHFSPKISDSDFIKLKMLTEPTYLDGDDIVENCKSLKNQLMLSQSKETTYKILGEYTGLMLKILKSVDAHILTYNDNVNAKEKKERSRYLTTYKWLKELTTRFSDYMKIIARTNIQYLIMSNNKDTLSFNCLDDSYLMKSKFIEHSTYKMYMSATVGDPDVFANTLGVTDTQFISVPDTFDYTNSPIYYVNNYKMSYAEKEISFPKIQEMIVQIFNMYPNMKGIVQTGNYSFATKLYESLSDELKDRVLVYQDSKSKQEQLDEFKFSSNKILVGPTLVEGISLDDDLCRFQIIMKVPYPSLSDNYVSEKMKYNSMWYSNVAATAILQGIGRGMRNANDWCVSFILDGCFDNVLRISRGMFNYDFMKRIQMISPSAFNVA